MRIGNGTFVLRSLQPLPTAKSSAVEPNPPERETLRVQLQRVQDELIDVRQALRQYRPRGRPERAPSVLGDPLNVSGPATAATLTSSAEVNAEATQLSTRKPQWTGTGGRAITIQGIYSGADNDTWTGTVQANNRLIRFTDSTGVNFVTVNIGTDPTVTSTRVVADGISISLAPGVALTPGDTFSFSLFNTQDGAIDPADPFNGVGNATPRFEQNVAITNGSFQVNGVSISVSTTDSLNTVLNRINTSVSGVTASYDATTEKVTLQTTGTGANQTLEITNDTSGLIAALKLNGLGQARGTGGGEAVMSQTVSLASVGAGRISINGTMITLDPTTQKLSEVLAQIDAIDGVTASLDSMNRVVLRGTSGQALNLTDVDNTGFFAAIGAATGDHFGRAGEQRKLSDVAARKIASEISQLRAALDDLADNEGLVGLAAEMRTESKTAVELALREVKGLSRFAEMTGLNDWANDDLASKSRTVHEVRRNYKAIRELMLGRTPTADGLLDRVADVIRDGLSQVADFDVRI